MSSHADFNLPKTYKGVLVKSPTEPPTVSDIPTPLPVPGAVIVRVLYASIVAYARDVFLNTSARKGYNYQTPLVPGGSCVGRVVAVPEDAAKLEVGQLVLCDLTIRARDDPTASILQGFFEGFTDGSKKLMKGEWRNGSWGELIKSPLENVHPLNEDRLINQLGYSLNDLAIWSPLLVPYGGLSDIGLKPGDTILIAPATGGFGGGAVRVALAMGARVIAMGRNKSKLDHLKTLSTTAGRVETVQITGDVNTDTASLTKFGPLDAFFDISPDMAADSSHIKAGITALKFGGKMSIMGGVMADVGFPYIQIMSKNLTLKGTYMYQWEQIKELIRMVEAGILPIGSRGGFKFSGYKLEEWKEALDKAAEGGVGEYVFFTPTVDK